MPVEGGGWIDWATRLPGPAAKAYAIANSGRGVCLHSMEGWYEGSRTELMNMARQASWQFSLRLSGELVQHYPVTASCWASGCFEANTKLWSVELEGVAGTPANTAQVRTLLRLGAEFEAATGLAFTRAQPNQTIFEHREVWDWSRPNAGPTACPSDRYAPLYAAMEEGDVTEDQVRALIAAALAERDQAEVGRLGSTQIEAVEALVRRSRAMALAKCLNDIIAANNPGVVP